MLVSNLANRLQPILRYDLGDSILQRPGPCPCGDPLPAIRVQGRTADVLTFPAEHGGRISIAPLALSALFDRTPEVELFQVVQTKPACLRIRLRPRPDVESDRLWQAVHDELSRLLAEHHLGHVAIEHADEPPQQSPGGKFREVVPLSEAAARSSSTDPHAARQARD